MASRSLFFEVRAPASNRQTSTLSCIAMFGPPKALGKRRATLAAIADRTGSGSVLNSAISLIPLKARPSPLPLPRSVSGEHLRIRYSPLTSPWRLHDHQHLGSIYFEPHD